MVLDDKGQIEIRVEDGFSGLQLEVDPITRPLAELLDFNFAFTYDYAPPVFRKERLPWASPDESVTAPMVDFRKVRVSTVMAALVDEPRLIAVWKPSEDSHGLLQCAFLVGEKVPVAPSPNKALAGLLNIHAGPPPKRTGGDHASLLPPGMNIAFYKVPRSVFDQAVPPGGAAASDKSGRHPDPQTVQKFLRDQGLLFPEGASAAFHAGTSMLIVINTQPTLDLVKAFYEGMDCRGIPNIVNLTLHIIQAEGPTLRKLVREAEAHSDHTAVWKKVETLAATPGSKLKRLQVARLETRTGQRARFDAVEERMGLRNLRSGGDAPESVEGAPAVETVPSVSPAPAGDLRFRALNYETTHVGTRFEVDAVIDASGEMVDINYALTYHYAPPTMALNPAADAPLKAGDQRIQIPGTEFHPAQLFSATTIAKGTTRLLGVWKPVGTPEFDGKDLLQAAFLKVEIVSPEPGSSALEPTAP